MKQGKLIRYRITSAFLLVLLCLPILSQAAHAFEDHDHPVCNEVKTHLHELEPECSVCDFHFVPFSFTTLELTLHNPSSPSRKFFTFFKNSLHSKLFFTRGQRGPPTLS